MAPALFLFLLHHFSKGILHQLTKEASLRPAIADPIGVCAAKIFSTADFTANGHTMIDILMAKFYKVCPVLLGIYGNEKTAEGRARLGWKQEGGSFVSEQEHIERMVGLGAGFAQIALRNFDKARMDSPLPPAKFWTAASNILNVPPQELQPTHLWVMKAMLEKSTKRILTLWGQYGLALLRKAMVDVPASVPEQSNASKSLALLPELIAKSEGLILW